MNWYVYCANNPLGWIDPTGMIGEQANAPSIENRDYRDYLERIGLYYPLASIPLYPCEYFDEPYQGSQHPYYQMTRDGKTPGELYEALPSGSSINVEELRAFEAKAEAMGLTTLELMIHTMFMDALWSGEVFTEMSARGRKLLQKHDYLTKEIGRQSLIAMPFAGMLYMSEFLFLDRDIITGRSLNTYSSDDVKRDMIISTTSTLLYSLSLAQAYFNTPLNKAAYSGIKYSDSGIVFRENVPIQYQKHHWWPIELGGANRTGITVPIQSTNPNLHTATGGIHPEMRGYFKSFFNTSTWKAAKAEFLKLNFNTQHQLLQNYYKTQGLNMPTMIKPGIIQ